MVFLALLAIPALIAIAFLLFGGKRITLQEFMMQMLAQAAAAHCSNTLDTEIWNGRVAEKKKERVSRSRSYSCNCYTSCSGSGSNRSCTTHPD